MWLTFDIDKIFEDNIKDLRHGMASVNTNFLNVSISKAIFSVERSKPKNMMSFTKFYLLFLMTLERA